jgi:hypothetical protein
MYSSPIKLLIMKQLIGFSIIVTLSFIRTTGQQLDKKSWYETPVALIEDIYSTVSIRDSGLVDWVRVKSMFLDEAVVILRTGPDEAKQFTVDGFIQDFKDFYEYPTVKAGGFEEKIVKLKSMVYKDIAFIGTVYSASVLGSDRPPQRGIDLWLLNKKDGEWKITAVVNEVIPAGQELPDEPEWRF